jgi:hypothetical protein
MYHVSTQDIYCQNLKPPRIFYLSCGRGMSDSSEKPSSPETWSSLVACKANERHPKTEQAPWETSTKGGDAGKTPARLLRRTVGGVFSDDDMDKSGLLLPEATVRSYVCALTLLTVLLPAFCRCVCSCPPRERRRSRQTLAPKLQTLNPKPSMRSGAPAHKMLNIGAVHAHAHPHVCLHARTYWRLPEKEEIRRERRR